MNIDPWFARAAWCACVLALAGCVVSTEETVGERSEALGATSTPGCSGTQPTPPVGLKWRDLVAGTTLNATTGLVLSVKSQVAGPARAVISYEILADGRYLAGSLPPISGIMPGTTRLASLDLRALTAGSDLTRMEFSGELIVSVDVTLDSGVKMGRASAEHVFFHGTSTTPVLAYDRGVYTNTFHAGDFRNRHAALVPSTARREGFVFGGNGLPPDVVAIIEAGDPR
jgi:hypothetical protein